MFFPWNRLITYNKSPIISQKKAALFTKKEKYIWKYFIWQFFDDMNILFYKKKYICILSIKPTGENITLVRTYSSYLF